MEKLVAFFLLVTAATVQSQQLDMVVCRTQRTCDGRGESGFTAEECCNHDLDPPGVAYTIPGAEGCNICATVFGFNETTFIRRERAGHYTVEVKFFSGSIETSFLRVGVELFGNQNDVSVTPTTLTFFSNVFSRTIAITLRDDGVSQEGNETFNITLTNLNGLESGATVFDRLEGTILDSDVINFELSEADYSMSEVERGNMNLTVTIRKIGDDKVLANPIMFKITPLIIEDAINMEIIKEENFPPDDIFSPYRADYEDFDRTIKQVTFNADEGRTFIKSVTVPITIKDDQKDEANEQRFIVHLEVVSAVQPELIGNDQRNNSIIRIIDNDPIEIGFVKEIHEFQEPDINEDNIFSIFLTKRDGRITEQTFSVLITVTDPTNIPSATLETDDGGDFDYNLGRAGIERLTLLFPRDVQNISFRIIINSDNLPEGLEGFQASSANDMDETYPDFLNPTRGSSVFALTQIHILDDDFAVVGFEQTMYTVNESSTFQEVCVIVTNPPDTSELAIEIILAYETVIGTADKNDFTEISLSNAVIIFMETPASPESPMERKSCFNVQITDDTLYEATESFTLSAQLFDPDQTGIVVQPNITEVKILDDDEVVIGFLSDSYITNENENEVTIQIGVLNGTLQDDVFVQISFEDGSALLGADYLNNAGLEIVLLFNADISIYNFSIPIVSNNVFELTEEFSADLTFFASAPRVTLSPNQTQITILDNDILEFGFDPTTYEVGEDDGSRELSVSLLSGNLGNFTVIVTTETRDIIGENAATANLDYEALSSEELRFTRNSTSQSFDIKLLPDDLTERRELFESFLVGTSLLEGDMQQRDLSPQEEGRILLVDNKAEIAITDADEATIGFIITEYDELESADNISFVFGVLEGELAFDVEIIFSTIEGSALSNIDFAESLVTSTLTGKENKKIEVLIVNDDRLENMESFFGNLTSGDNFPSNVKISPFFATANITDEDEVIIGFVESYEVSEGVNLTVPVEVAVVKGVLEKAVVVRVFTADDSAQAPGDYSERSEFLTFFADNNVLRFIVDIMNDNILEPTSERFFTRAKLALPDSRVTILPQQTNVTIIDDDKVTIGININQTAASVPENVGFANVTISLIGRTDREVPVLFSTSDGTATSIGSEKDFDGISSMVLVFPASDQERQEIVVQLRIFDDEFVETSSEDLLARLEVDESIINPSSLSILIDIVDDDTVTVGFVPATFEVQENDKSGHVEVEVGIISGILRRPVQVDFSISDNTAIMGLDYNAVGTTTLIFNSNVNSTSIFIPIINDTLHEDIEDFRGLLTTTEPSVVTLDPQTAVIQIIDDEALFFSFRLPSQSFLESDERGRVFIDKMGVTDQAISLRVSGPLQEETGLRIDRVLTFEPLEVSVSVDFDIVDDLLPLEETEILMWSLSLVTEVTGASVGPHNETEILILDDDVLQLQLVKNREVPESQNAQACITFSSKFGMDFSVIAGTFVTPDVSKQAIPGIDYTERQGSLLANSSVHGPDVNLCFEVLIVNDSFVEEEECFGVFISLSSNDLKVLIADGGNSSICCIQDDDSVVIGFEPVFNRVSESGGNAVLILKVLMGTLMKSVVVNFTTEDSSAIAGSDYSPVGPLSLTFDESTDSVEVRVPIIEDSIAEDIESFNGLLSTSEDSVVLGPSLATIQIEDNDIVVIGFDSASYQVSESDDSVVLTVRVLMGTLMKSVKVNFTTEDISAIAGSDYSPVGPLSLTFNESTDSVEVTVPIIEDNIAEDIERFNGLLSTSENSVLLDPSLTAIQIEDNDIVVIGFDSASYQVSESDGSVVLTVRVLMGTLMKSVTVNFTTEDISAIAGSDYSPVGPLSLTFDESTDSVEVTVPIIEDSIAEDIESFNGLLSTIDNSVVLDLSLATIQIDDNDTVVIGFDSESYLVSENDGSVVLTVKVLMGTLMKSVTVNFTTEGGSAIAGSDFIQVGPVLLTFDRSMDAMELVVPIINDGIAEGIEDFNGILSTTETSVILNPSLTTISIADNDTIVIGFDPASSRVSESGGNAVLTVKVLMGSLMKSVMVNFTTEDGSAIAGTDYSPIGPLSLTFDESTDSVQVTVPIIEDNIAENVESFNGILSSMENLVTLKPSLAEIQIEDNDTVVIGFDSASYQVSESDGSVVLTVRVLMGSLMKSVTVNFTTEDISAIAGSDYSPVGPLSLTFDESTDSVEVSVPIIEDNIAEDIESFNGLLSTSEDSVVLGPSLTAIQIEDNDTVVIGFDSASYQVSESDGSVVLTVRVLMGTLMKSVTVNFTTEDISAIAGSDYSPVGPLSLTFDESTDSVEVTVPIIEDNIAEDIERFNGLLSTIDNSVVLDPSLSTIQIVDTDTVVIGFDSASHQVSESDDSVVLTVRVLMGTLMKSVTVNFTTADISAIAGSDYSPVGPLSLTFDESTDSVEVIVPIIEDNIAEDIESFNGLLSTSEDSVVLDPSLTTIQIEDNDIVVIGFDSTSHLVSESDGSVVLTARILMGTLMKSVTVNFTTEDISAFAGSDYSPVGPLSLTFDESTDSIEVTVPIIEDNIAEDIESFNGLLSTSEDSVVLGPSLATIQIEDNDTVVIGFDSASYQVSESDDSVVLTVRVLMGTLMKSVTVNFTTEDISAIAGSDYSPIGPLSLTFDESTDSIEVTVPIIEDNIAEDIESFNGLLSTSENSVVLDPSLAIIQIEDNDTVIIGFDSKSYQVSESDGSVVLTVRVLNGTLMKSVTVNFTTENGSAIADSDYSHVGPLLLTFDQNSTSSEITISITSDNVAEFVEEFSGILSTREKFVVLEPLIANITIEDDDPFELPVKVNDTIIGDPLFTLPIYVPEEQLEALNIKKLSLCYEIHGKPDQWFNLVTDECTTVNAQYIGLSRRLNVIDKIGVRAVDEDDQCSNILVDVNQCSANVNGMNISLMDKYSSGGINVKRYSNRVRISVPNCADITLVMWVICQHRPLDNPDVPGTKITADLIKFVIMRGLNFGHRLAHGLLGQFWNVPVSIKPFSGLLKPDAVVYSEMFTVNITTNGNLRTYPGWISQHTWDTKEEGPCLHVGNSQGGPLGEVIEPNDGVIESTYKSYRVNSAFSEENYSFGLFSEDRCSMNAITDSTGSG